MDGSDIMELVENEKVLSKFVDHKFKELDRLNNHGKISVSELHPAVAHNIGLPPQGSSPDSDLVYSEVLNEFINGKREKVSKTEFKEVASDILLGMAAGLKRDPIVILRMDGEELQEYVNSPSFETDAVSTFSEVQSSDATLRDHIVKALQNLGVDQGLPPTSDSWVMSNVVEPALEPCVDCENDQQPVSQETFLTAFKKVLENIVARLREQLVIVAHTENTYDGSAIRSLLANKFETEKVLKAALETVPRDKIGRISKEYLRVALDSLALSTSLPPCGALSEMDEVINNVLKTVEADDGKAVKEEEFKKLMVEILGSIMLQLEGKPLSVAVNSVVHEPLADRSPLLQTGTS